MTSLLATVEFCCAAVVFVALLFVNAPYGRYARAGWGPCVPARFGWMIMEFPAFCVIAWMVLTKVQSVGWYGIAFLVLWEIHYTYRVALYPFLMPSPRKPFPILLVFFAICFNALNATANGGNLVASAALYRTSNWAADSRFWIGCGLFAAGFLMHAHSDRIVRKLRNNSGGKYGVPYGGMFRFVASPNYLGEIVEWAGWAIATWSLAGAAFAAFTVANLLPRAISNRTWYRHKFPNFPKERKILIPFVW